MAAEAPTKRVWRANFSDEEVMVMIVEWKKREQILREKFARNVTAEVKRKAWDEITFLVNAVAAVQRTRDDIKKKFRDFRSAVKKKAAEIKKNYAATGMWMIGINLVHHHTLVSLNVISFPKHLYFVYLILFILEWQTCPFINYYFKLGLMKLNILSNCDVCC